MLEPSNLRETVQTAVNEFVDLEANYKHLVDTREQEHRAFCHKGTNCRIDTAFSATSFGKQSIAAYFGELFAAL